MRLVSELLTEDETMKILAVKVVLSETCDSLLIDTDLPNGIWPYKGTQLFKTDVAYDKGVSWARENLGMEPEIIDMRVTNL